MGQVCAERLHRFHTRQLFNTSSPPFLTRRIIHSAIARTFVTWGAGLGIASFAVVFLIYLVEKYIFLVLSRFFSFSTMMFSPLWVFFFFFLVVLTPAWHNFNRGHVPLLTATSLKHCETLYSWCFPQGFNFSLKPRHLSSRKDAVASHPFVSEPSVMWGGNESAVKVLRSNST